MDHDIILEATVAELGGGVDEFQAHLLHLGSADVQVSLGTLVDIADLGDLEDLLIGAEFRFEKPSCPAGGVLHKVGRQLIDGVGVFTDAFNAFFHYLEVVGENLLRVDNHVLVNLVVDDWILDLDEIKEGFLHVDGPLWLIRRYLDVSHHSIYHFELHRGLQEWDESGVNWSWSRGHQ